LGKLNKQATELLFRSFQDLKFLVVGDVMLDKYLRGNVSRISPEAPVPIVELESEQYHFGGAANVALNLQALGCKSLSIGILGDDRNAEHFVALLREENLDNSGFIQIKDRFTTVKTRIIGDNQHMVRVDREQIVYDDPAVDLAVIAKFEELAPNVDAIVLEDYNKGLLGKTVIEHILNYAREHNIITTVDPKFINFTAYKNATVFKPNIKETAQALALEIRTNADTELAGTKLLDRLKAKNVLLTRGAQGMSLFESSGEVSHIPAQTRRVADVSGAGDTVIATLTAFMAAGLSAEQSAIYANYAAGQVCGEVGIVPVDKNELRNEIIRTS